METFGLAISVISTCIDLAQQIDSLIQKFKDARSELHDGIKTVASTRKLLSQFHTMFQNSSLPQEILQDYLSDILPLQAELESIQSFLNQYLPLYSRKGLAGLAWRYRWGREIDRHQKNLIQLNGHLHDALATLNLKVGFLALEIIRGGPASTREAEPEPVTHQTLSAIGQAYLEAANAFRSREMESDPAEVPPIARIQRRYSSAAREFQNKEWNKRLSTSMATIKAFQGEEWNKPFTTSIAIAVQSSYRNLMV